MTKDYKDWFLRITVSFPDYIKKRKKLMLLQSKLEKEKKKAEEQKREHITNFERTNYTS